MRALACLALLAFAGCTSPGSTDPATVVTHAPDAVAAPPSTPAPDPFRLDANGTLWLPPTTGADPAESRVPFQLNATADVLVTLRLGSTLTPIATADAVVELRDASGDVLAQATFSSPGMPPNEKTLHAAQAAAGSYGLHFATYGGSDGSSSGDYIAYRIQAKQVA